MIQQDIQRTTTTTTSSPESGWRNERSGPSLPEVFGSIAVPKDKGFWRTLLAFVGPGLMVSVGYMDPGNWATDIAGGAQFGYLLISIILISNLMAILLQYLSLKLGIATGRDLAQACREHYSRPVVIFLWILCEIAIAACDLAEVIGSAVALNLLLHIPLIVGVVITAFDVIIVLFLQHHSFRWIEIVVITLISMIALCFLYEVVISRPEVVAVLGGFIPSPEIIFNPSALYIAIGILGATVMPHNLYLHSSIVQTRAFEPSEEGKRKAIKFATIDSTTALMLAFFINAAILIVSAATFHGTQYANVADISDAYKLLAPVLGIALASPVFAIALLASGQSSTMTGTLAGQIVMEGFVHIRVRPWLRRLITRALAITPAIIVVILYGERGVGQLLILSQVVLSLQLSFAVVPLVQFTSERAKMGVFTNSRRTKIIAWGTAFVIAALNIYLLVQTVSGWIRA